MALFGDRIKVACSTSGTGSTLTLGSAVSGFQTLSEGGLSNGDSVRYILEDGSSFEIGLATYATGSPDTLTGRSNANVSASSNSNNAISLSGSSTLFIAPTAADLQTVHVYSATSDLPSATDNHGKLAHVHNLGRIVFAHGGNWISLANASEITSYTLPTASASTLGGVKVGNNLSIDGSGVLSASAGSSLTVQEEGSSLSTAATTLNFVGSGVTASGTGATKTITISGGSGGGSATSALTETTFSATANQTAFNVTGGITNANNVSVFQNGVKLEEGSAKDYTVNASTNTLTLTSGATLNDVIEVLEYGQPSTITADGLTVSGDAVFGPDNDGVRITGTNYATLRLEENDTTDLNTSMFNSVGDFVITTSSDDRSTTTDRIRLDHSTGDVRFYGNVGVAMDADSAVRLSVSGAVGTTNGSESSPTHTFYGDPDTGMYRAAANTLGFSTGGTERLRISSTAVVINEGGADLDFRVESDNSTDAIRVDASSDDVIFGSSATGNSNAYFGNVHSADTFFYVANNSSTTSTPPVFINRQNNDGSLIIFRQGDADEGSIEVSGSTVSLNGFSGKHEASGISTSVEIGTVVSTIDELDVYSDTQPDVKTGEEISNPKAGQTRADHAKVKVSDTVGDKRVYGVVSKFTPENKVMVTSLGIGSVLVTGACNGGDLLESNGDGIAKVQSDDIIRSKTIGKVTIGNSDTGVKLVSCVMYCG